MRDFEAAATAIKMEIAKLKRIIEADQAEIAQYVQPRQTSIAENERALMELQHGLRILTNSILVNDAQRIIKYPEERVGEYECHACGAINYEVLASKDGEGYCPTCWTLVREGP